MKVSFDYQSGISEIDELLRKMPQMIEKEEKSALRRIGNVVKKNIVKFTHDSGIEVRAKQIVPSNYDNSKPYVHIKKDVSATVRKDKQGNFYVSIHGGKYTGYKWHLLNDGHLARDGRTFIKGSNFMGRAMTASEGEIDRIVTETIKKVVE